MRIAIKNQYTSKQKEQKTLPGSLAYVPTFTYNQADHTLQNSGKVSSLSIWRKSSFPTSSSNHASMKISDINKPNGYVYRGADISMCIAPTHSAIVHETHRPNTEAESKCHYDVSNNRWVGPNPETTVKRTATTIISPDYSTTTKGYHERKGIQIEQHQSFVRDPSQRYVDERGTPIGPSPSSTQGSQVYLLTSTTFPNACKKTTYKPRNQAFRTSGAVTSSARTSMLQNNTLTKGNQVFYRANSANRSSNYIPYTSSNRLDDKYFTELQCNTSILGLTRIRHALRSSFVRHKQCRDCDKCSA